MKTTYQGWHVERMDEDRLPRMERMDVERMDEDHLPRMKTCGENG